MSRLAVLLVVVGMTGFVASARGDLVELAPTPPNYSNLSAGVAIVKDLYGASGLQVFSLPDSNSISKSGYGGTSTETINLTSQGFDASYSLMLAKSASAEVGGGGVVYFIPTENIQYTLGATISLADKTTTSAPTISLNLQLSDDSNYSLPPQYYLYQSVSQNNYNYTLNASNPNALGSLTGTLVAGDMYEWDPDIFVTNANKNPISETGTVDFSLTFSPIAAPLPKPAAAGAALLALAATGCFLASRQQSTDRHSA